MKKLLPAIFLLLSISSFAQITIQQNDLPQPGDTFMLYVDKTPTVSLGSPSASSQVWNYSALANDSTKYAPYGITANLPFASYFPTSNSYTFGPAVLYGGPGSPSPGSGVGYTMWGINSTGMWVIGYRSDYDGHGEKNVFTNPNELLMPVPITYGYNQQHDSKWEILMNYIALDADTLYRSRTHKTFTCDAWGSMTTPLGTFANVIRVHEYSITTDSVFGLIGSTVVFSMKWKSDTINKYYFWAPEQRHPVATAYCNTAGVLQRIEWVSWIDLNVPVVSNDNQNMTVFPNPASGNVNIQLPEAFKKYGYTMSVTDLNGKLILKQNGTGCNAVFQTTSFTQGCYSVEVKSETGIIYRSKFIVR